MASFRAVKSPEVPRPFFQKPAEPSPSEEKESKSPEPKGKVVPKYVEIPALREHGFGPRNLFWGVATLFVALVLLLAALFFAGGKATLSLATALLTFTALFVLSRMHVFRQRNGGFLALAVVCLLGTVVPLLESGFTALKSGAITFTKGSSATTATAAVGEDVPLLTKSFALPPLHGSAKRVRATKDVKVVIDERPFMIRAGDVFPFLEVKGGEAFFAVRDLRVSLPSSVVEVIDPSSLAKGVTGGKGEPDPGGDNGTGLTPLPPPAPTSDELALITDSAKKEAVRRYPALGMQNSIENEVFVSTYQRLKKQKEAGGTDFFANPEWPLELAEYLAKSSGWVRGAAPTTAGPAPVLDPPTGAGVVEDEVVGRGAPRRPPANNPGAVDTLDAGAGLPGGTR